MNDVTRILTAIEAGETNATDQLLPLVYDELRKLAKSQLMNESSGNSLQPTALVHEAYLRIVDAEDANAWNSRSHFFGAAAQAMRRILIENARRKQRARHGGGRKRVDFENVDLTNPNDSRFLTALDQALDSLEEQHPQVAEVVKLRFFAGLSIEETADAIGVSVRTVNRHWAFAKAWLYKNLADEDEGVGSK